jgi:hypothetical protein
MMRLLLAAVSAYWLRLRMSKSLSAPVPAHQRLAGLVDRRPHLRRALSAEGFQSMASSSSK